LQDNSSWTPGYAAINFPIIRFADVLLMAAEAEIESSAGSADKAKEYVNRVRQRAKNSPLLKRDGTPAANYKIDLYTDGWSKNDDARAKIRFERKLELAGEGHRFYDLVRWGIAAQTINAYLTYEAPKTTLGALAGATFTAGQDELLPLPQSQIDLLTSDILKQNPGY
jgi:hypothetical protein